MCLGMMETQAGNLGRLAKAKFQSLVSAAKLICKLLSRMLGACSIEGLDGPSKKEHRFAR